jgi:hypothetical protein
MPSEAELEELAKKRVQARVGFTIHLVIFLVMNVGFFAIWALTGSGYPWFMWPMLFWGIGLISHAVTLGFGPGSSHERRAIEREVQRLRAAAR